MTLTDDKALGITLMGPHDSMGIVQHALLLTDYHIWGPIQDELDQWLEGFDAERQGMLLTWRDPEFFIMFKLRWG